MRRVVVAWLALLAVVVASPLQSQSGAADLQPALDSLISRLAAADSFSGAVMFVPAKGRASPARRASCSNARTRSGASASIRFANPRQVTAVQS